MVAAVVVGGLIIYRNFLGKYAERVQKFVCSKQAVDGSSRFLAVVVEKRLGLLAQRCLEARAVVVTYMNLKVDSWGSPFVRPDAHRVLVEDS